MPIELFEAVCFDTLNASGYLLANPDVARCGVDPRAHFLQYGVNEGRRQINSAIVEPTSSYRAGKYRRFSPLLGKKARERPPIFPMVVGRDHYNLAAYAGESANRCFGPFEDEMESNPTKNYLDIGCGLRSKVYENCLYLEVYPAITADLIVEPNNTYPIEDGVLDGIGCFAVLEHTSEPWKVIDEIRRMLKPGGKVFIDWPFLQPVHGYPSHYFNATRKGLVSRFSEWCDVIDAKTYPNQTPDYTAHWILGKMINDLPKEKRTKIKNLTVGELIASPPGGEFWRWVLDGTGDFWTEEFSCGNSLVGRKRL
jgi:SAM-dependent methyltransferase